MKVLELRSENVKRLNVVVIRPKGNVVIVHGGNGEGKSSVLDSIEMALAGKSAQPPVVIKRGADYGETELDLGEYVVRRRWTKGSDKLNVESKDGGRYGQKKLDELIGEISFDPLAFIRLKPAAQADIVKKMVQCDTSQVEADYKIAYDKRTKAGNEGKAMKARLDALPVPAADVPDELVTVDQLLDKQAELQKIKDTHDKARGQVAIIEAQLGAADLAERQQTETVERLEKELNQARHVLEEVQAKRRELYGMVAKAKEIAATLVDPDMTGLYQQVRNAEAINERVRAKKAYLQLSAEVDAKRSDVVGLHDQVEKFESEKARIIKAAKFPVDGMSFSSDGGLVFNDLPLEQASSAEQLRVGLALSIALNPKLRVAFIRDGSLLDDRSMDLVEEIATKYDMQIWIERVGPGKVGFEIVDGYVVSVDGQPVEKPEPQGSPPRGSKEPEAPSQLQAANDLPPPALSLVKPQAEAPPPAALSPPAKAEKVRGTFKNKQISALTGEELGAAILEVEASILAKPLAPKSTRSRAVLEDLKAEQQIRMDAAISAAPVAEGREPGSDG